MGHVRRRASRVSLVTLALAAATMVGLVAPDARADDRRERLAKVLERERVLVERAVALHSGLAAMEHDQRTLAWTSTMLEHRTRESMRRLDAYRDGETTRGDVARRRMRSLARLARGGLVSLALAPVLGEGVAEGEDAVRARLTRARTLRLVIRRDVDELDVFRRAVRRVEAEAATVRREAAALSTLAMMHAVERQALTALEDELEPALVKAERQRQRLLRGYELRRDERDVLASILTHRGELGRGGVALLERGRLARPVRGEIVGRFGTSKDPVLGVEIDRAGVELGARRGEPVVAPADGDVVMVSDLPGFDRVVVIDHGDGVRTMLARLSDVRVQVGARVAGGQRIGRVAPKTLDDGLGTTVYLEVRHAERAVDPTRLLVGAVLRRGSTSGGASQEPLGDAAPAGLADETTSAPEPTDDVASPTR